MFSNDNNQKKSQENLVGGGSPKNPNTMIQTFDQSGRFGQPNDKIDLRKQQGLDRLEAEQKREQQKAAEEAEALKKKQDQERAAKEEQAKKEKLELERVEQEKKDQEKKELEEKQRLEQERLDQEERDRQQKLKKPKPEKKEQKKKNGSSTKSESRDESSEEVITIDNPQTKGESEKKRKTINSSSASVSKDEIDSSTEEDNKAESSRKTKKKPEPEPMVTVDSDSESNEKDKKTPNPGQSSSTTRDALNTSLKNLMGTGGTGRFQEDDKKQAVKPTPEEPVKEATSESAKKEEPKKEKEETKPTPPTTPMWKVFSVGANFLLCAASLWGVPASARYLSSLATSRGYAGIAEGLLSNKGYALGAVPFVMCGMGLRSPKAGTLGLWLAACGSAAASYKEGNIYPGIITAVATIVGSFAYAMSGDTKAKELEAGRK